MVNTCMYSNVYHGLHEQGGMAWLIQPCRAGGVVRRAHPGVQRPAPGVHEGLSAPNGVHR